MSGLQLLYTSDGLNIIPFSAPPTCSVAPTTDNQLANKQYVDDSVEAVDVTNSTFSQPIMQTLLTANASNKSNTALGENSFPNYYSNSIGSNNTAVGQNSNFNNLSGSKNTAVGSESLKFNGESNTAVGYNTLSSTTSSSSHYNTAIGTNSMSGLKAGANFNTAIGYDSGSYMPVEWTSSAYGNTLLGAGTYMTNNFTFSTAVGANSVITKDNQIVMGRANETVTIPKFTTAGVVHNLANGDLTSSLIVTADITSNAITAGLLATDISYNGLLKVRDCSGGVATQAANKKYVDDQISILTINAPVVLDTLKEIADKLIDASGVEIYARLAGPTFTGTVSGVTATMVSLGNVTNTSDANKPVSTAQQTALDLKADLASPTFTGNPTAPTPDTSDNDTTVATTAFVKNQSYITSSSLGVMPSSAPISSVAGSFYFDVSGNVFNVYNGTGWVSTTLTAPV